jgi:putative phosphoesterase
MPPLRHGPLPPLAERLRPPDLAPQRVAACLGLCSDTHLPDRCLALPQSLSDLFRGLDLILHAGDVGQLAVLDTLSALAPTVAVHGNDECEEETPRELPYQQVVAVAGQRIVLTHGHEPDPAREQAARAQDAWTPKLARRAAFGHRAGARIVVYGHTHIPTSVLHDGVWLINPGAIASAGLDRRQRRQTVALLYLRDDGHPCTVHVDLAQPDRPCHVQIDWAAGFRAAQAQFEESILAPDLRADYAPLRRISRAFDATTTAAIRAAVREVALRCWAGEQETITRADLLDALRRAPGLAPAARAELLSLLESPPSGGA